MASAGKAGYNHTEADGAASCHPPPADSGTRGQPLGMPKTASLCCTIPRLPMGKRFTDSIKLQSRHLTGLVSPVQIDKRSCTIQLIKSALCSYFLQLDCLSVHSTLDRRGTIQAGFLIKRNDIDFTKAGSIYEIGFDKREFSISGTVSSEPRPSRLLKVDCDSICRALCYLQELVAQKEAELEQLRRQIPRAEEPPVLRRERLPQGRPARRHDQYVMAGRCARKLQFIAISITDLPRADETNLP